MTGWIVMRSTRGKLLQSLGKGSRNWSSPQGGHLVGRKLHNIIRTIKGVMYIRANDVSLSRNTGKFQLFHIWNDVLLNTPALPQGVPSQLHLPTACGPHPLLVGKGAGDTWFVSASHSTGRVCGPPPSIRCQTIWHQVSLFIHPMVPSVVFIILVSITFSHRPDEVMLFGMMKAYMTL